MIGKTYTVPVKTTEEGESIIEFPEEMLDSVGWKEGDRIDWKANGDGSYTLTKIEKVETVWVLVEAISTFRHRYMVEVPASHPDYALDTVTMNEAVEFSQCHIGEQIVSHRVMSKEDALDLCDEDNDYAKGWKGETKLDAFFTPIREEEMYNE